MIQPTRYVRSTKNGKVIPFKPLIELVLELTDGDGNVNLQEMAKEIKRDRDGIRRPEDLRNKAEKLMRGEIQPDEYVREHNVHAEHESERMKLSDPCGVSREFI